MLLTCYYFCIVSSLYLVLEAVEKAQLCSGNSDEKFLTLPGVRKGVMKDKSSMCKLFYELKLCVDLVRVKSCSSD